MAKATRSPLLQGIKGSVGNLVFRQMPDGSTWISGAPDFSQRKFSKGQKDHQSRFQEAAAYARAAARSQPIYAELAKGTMKSAYNFALSDWFHPPVIHSIERQGERIRVKASDNVMVAKVRVTIMDEQGAILEQGQAAQMDALWWEYAAGKSGKVLAEAWDLAGNVVGQEIGNRS